MLFKHVTSRQRNITTTSTDGAISTDSLAPTRGLATPRPLAQPTEYPRTLYEYERPHLRTAIPGPRTVELAESLNEIQVGGLDSLFR